MSSAGIKVTVEFTEPDICPIATVSEDAETTIDSVATSACSADCANCVTEFSTDADYDPDGDVSVIFSHGSTRRFRFSHEPGVSCPCECLGEFGCAIARYAAREGTLTIVFYATDYEELKDIVSELRERFPGVDIKRFVRAPSDDSDRDDIVVDRSKLTSRQLEILETALEMGYFERPRRANATEIASTLDINPSTFQEHLAAAESKMFEEIL